MRAVSILAILLACERPPAIEGNADELSFRSREVVPLASAEQMIQEASKRRNTWAGHLYLVGPGAILGRHLIGHHCIRLGDYETDGGQFHAVSPADDRAMACAEVRRDIDLLSDWSRRFPVRWDVRLGVRKARVPDGPDLGRFVDAVCDPAAADRTAEIDRRYSDRPR